MFKFSVDVSAASVQSHDLVVVDNVTLRQQALVAERDVRPPALTSAARWRSEMDLSFILFCSYRPRFLSRPSWYHDAFGPKALLPLDPESPSATALF